MKFSVSFLRYATSSQQSDGVIDASFDDSVKKIIDAISSNTDTDLNNPGNIALSSIDVQAFQLSSMKTADEYASPAPTPDMGNRYG